MQGVIHYNPNLSHQVDHAKAFQACGFGATSSPYDEADIHVISGNWFAYQQWKDHPRTLMINRAYWGDPDCVSIGWLQKDGSRKFAQGSAPRSKPEMRAWKQPWPTFGEMSCLILADYGQDINGIADAARKRFVQTEVRRHPADTQRGKFDNIPLTDQVAWYDCVIATSSSAAFAAIIRGIPIICLDPRNPCAPVSSDSIGGEMYRGDRTQWLHDLSYAQFSLSEINDGTAWQLLKDIQ